MPGTDPQPDDPVPRPSAQSSAFPCPHAPPAACSWSPRRRRRHEYACAFTAPAASNAPTSSPPTGSSRQPPSPTPPTSTTPALPTSITPTSRLRLASGAQGLPSHRRHLQPALVSRGGDRPRLPPALRRAPGSPGHFVGALLDQILSDKLKGSLSRPSAYRLSSSTPPTSTKTQDSGSPTPSTTSNPSMSSTIPARPAMSGRPSPPSDPGPVTRPPISHQQEDPQCPKNSKPSRSPKKPHGPGARPPRPAPAPAVPSALDARLATLEAQLDPPHPGHDRPRRGSHHPRRRESRPRDAVLARPGHHRRRGDARRHPPGRRHRPPFRRPRALHPALRRLRDDRDVSTPIASTSPTSTPPPWPVSWPTP